MSISSKVLLYIALIGIVLTIISSTFMLSKASDIEQDVLDTTKRELLSLLDSQVKSKKDVGLSNVISIANNKNIALALNNNDRDTAIAILRDVGKKFKDNTQYQNVKLHLHTKDTKSFVRSWNTEKFGDDLSSFRETLIHVKKTKRSFVSFEAGRSGLVLRGVTPLFHEGEFVGSLEFVQGMNSIARSFDTNEKYFLFLMDDTLVSIATKAQNAPSVSNYKLSQKFLNKDFLVDAQTIDMQQLKRDGFLISKNYYYTFETIKDFQDKTLGIFLVGQKIESVEKSIEASKELVYQAIIFIVILIFYT